MQRNGYAVTQPMSPYGFRKEGALRELLWELSNKEFSIVGMYSKYRSNVTFLGRAAEAIGKQYECRPSGEPCGDAPDESRGEYEFEAPALRAPPWPWESSVSDRLFARCVQPVDASTADDCTTTTLMSCLGRGCSPSHSMASAAGDLLSLAASPAVPGWFRPHSFRLFGESHQGIEPCQDSD